MELRVLADAAYSEELEIIADEVIDQYVGEELSDEERKQVEEHFFRTPARRDKLKFALALKKRRSVLSSPKFRRRRLYTFYLPIAASIIVAVGLGTVVWRTVGLSDLDKGLAALRNAYRDQRPIEGRIADFNYAPFTQLRGDDQGRVDYTSRDRAERIIHDTVNDKPDAAAFHALGQAYLARREYDNATDQFEKALKLDPTNAKLHSDMGAALVERGKAERVKENAGKSVETFARSLEHFNKALELDPSLLDALFNRALLYEYMMLPKQAEADWKKYLEQDSKSPWAAEARKYLRLLEKQEEKLTRSSDTSRQAFASAYSRKDSEEDWSVLDRNQARTGNAVIEGLIDEYLARTASGQSAEGEVSRGMLQYAGKLEVAKSGDRFTSLREALELMNYPLSTDEAPCGGVTFSKSGGIG